MAKVRQTEKAYNFLRQKLVSKTLPSGTRLVEKTWAQELGVNRADVRQALSRLLGEGLLSSGSKGGFFVREFSDQDMREINEVRLIIETAAVRLAIRRATPDDIKELFEICDHMKLLAENGYFLGECEADLRFHEILVRAAHNPRLEQVYRLANLPLSTNKVGAGELDKTSLCRDAECHREIVEAVAAGNADRAISLLVDGLNKNGQTTWDQDFK